MVLTEPWSSLRAASTLKHQAVSLASLISFGFILYFLQFIVEKAVVMSGEGLVLLLHFTFPHVVCPLNSEHTNLPNIETKKFFIAEAGVYKKRRIN